MRVVFSKIANDSYEDIIEFLSKTWTEKEITVFVNDVTLIVSKLKEGKFNLYQKYSKDIRSALIGRKHVRMYFKRESKNQINILFFFDMRQNPQKIFELLK
ncbi:hypothetical protein ABS765_15315 [Chryseobacterium sp. ST-37]|uniref:Plasmid stabilization system protein ParE n=1 Tax=Chryseobacterium terrae TaxID=3163299 RepID=A0ABW8Y7U3_9FLAO